MPAQIASGPSDEDLVLLQPVRDSVERQGGGAALLGARFPQLVRSAIDFVVDPIGTSRTAIADLDNVEKTFVGLKVEHWIRDLLNVPKGRRDLVLDGVDVDVKNTVGKQWMIPKETYSESGICLLSRLDDRSSVCWLGLFVARDAYLGSSRNRDAKRGLNPLGRERILWLLEAVPYPSGPWQGLDMQRFRELRRIPGGAARAALFFEENLDRQIPREVVNALLFDQKDYMKRLRPNGGAPDILESKGITLHVDTNGNCFATRG